MGVTALIGSGLLANGVPPAQAAVNPVATNDFYPGDGGEHLTIAAPGVLANDSDADGYRALLMSAPAGGTVALDPDGSFDYDPQGVTGEHTFTYCLVEAQGGAGCVSNTATVSLFIAEPFVALHSYSVVEGETLTVDAPGLLEGSRNPGPDDSLYEKSSPSHGHIGDFHADGSFSYTPDAGYNGIDAFAYCFSNEQVWPRCSGNAGTAIITVTEAVNVDTTTALSGPGSVFYGQSATLTATVAPSVDGGSVNFSGDDGAISACAAKPLTGSAATCVVPAGSLGPGAHTFTAKYSGAGTFQPSTSTSRTVTVEPAPTELAYTGDTSGTIGTPIHVSAQLTNVADGATGPVAGQSVRFGMANGLMCTAETDSAGTASCSLTPNRVGNLAVTVAFNGDTHYQGAQIDGVAMVAKKDSTTSLRAVPNAVPWSDDVTLTASVTDGATGSVAFSVGGSTIGACAAVPVTDGTAACVAESLEVGAQLITANYSGDGTYATSSATATVQVQQRSVDISYTGPGAGTVGPELALQGTAVDHVSGDPIAGLRLDLSFQGQTCGGSTDASGTASCNVFVDEAGTSDATVTFAGDTHYGAKSATGQVTIDKAAALVTVTVDPTPTNFTLPVTVIATVTPTDGGTVAFTTTGGVAVAGCDAVALVQDNVQVLQWTASCTAAALPVGDNEITATFSGTANYVGSAGSATATVRPASTEVTYTGPSAGTVAAPLAVSAVLNHTAGADPVPLAGQTVVFALAGGIACSAVTDDSGIASCTLTPTAIAQSGYIRVTFARTSDYLDSAQGTAITVNPATTTTVVTAPETAPFGSAATIDAIVAPSDGAGTVAFTVADAPIAGCDTVTPTELNGSWTARCVTSTLPIGANSIAATFSGTADYRSSFGTATVTMEAAATGLVYTGATTGTVGAPLVVSAVLTNTDAGSALAGQLVDFSLGGNSCIATTGDDGTATCRLPITSVAQAGELTVSFAGTDTYLKSTATEEVSIDPAAMSLEYLGDTDATVGTPLAVSAVIRLAGALVPTGPTGVTGPTGPTGPAGPAEITDTGHGLRAAGAFRAAAAPATVSLAGLRLVFTLGSAHCEGVTDAAGSASCSLMPTAADPDATLTVTFAGTTDLRAADLAVAIAVAAAPVITPPTTSDPAPAAVADAPPPSALAFTGFAVGGWLGAALLLLGAGALLLLTARRRVGTWRS